jgi:hypothetical protein
MNFVVTATRHTNHQLHAKTLDSGHLSQMEVDKSNTANELAFLLVEECQKLTYSAYSNEGDVNDVARNPNIDRQYESRLDRAIADTQAKIQSQKRVLEDVLSFIVLQLIKVTPKATW